MELQRHLTRDGGLTQVGSDYYLHARLHDPNERVRLLGFITNAPSWLDGRPTSLWRVRNGRGVEMACEAWQLSRQHPEDLYRMLRGTHAQEPPP